jgi:hypothetical protein
MFVIMKKTLYAVAAVIVVGGWSVFAQEESATREESATQGEGATQKDEATLEEILTLTLEEGDSSHKEETPKKRSIAAVGLRFGYNNGYNTGYNKYGYFTLDADYRVTLGSRNGFDLSVSYSFVADAGDELLQLVGGDSEVMGIFEWRGVSSRRSFLSWYAGPGLKLGIYRGDYFGFGVGAQFGIGMDIGALIDDGDLKDSYKPEDFEYTLDIRPMYVMAGGVSRLTCSIGFSIRYKL